MNTTPSSPLHVTSTTAPDRPRPDQDQPQIDATKRAPAAGERALVLGGGGSTGNAWLIGVIAGLFDAGLDVTEADLIIGTSAGSTAAAQITSATPTELLAAILAAAPQPRTGPVGSDGGRVPIGPVVEPSGENEPDHRRRRGCGRHAPQDGCGGARDWMRRRTAPGRRGGARPSPPGCPVSAGRNERCSSRRSMPIPVNRSCSTATAESTWWTPLPPALPAAPRTASATAGTSTAATDPSRTPTWQPDTGGCWCCHHSAADRGIRGSGARIWQRRSTNCAHGGSRVETIFPDSDSEHLFGANAMDLSLRPPAARAGYDQGRALAEQLTEFWR